jgi:hypothetical protein
MKDAKPIKTHMGTNGHLDLDTGGKSVDQKVYRSVGTMLRRQRSCGKKHLRQICLYVVPKLPLMKLRYYNTSEDEGSNRLKDGMTF